MLNVGATKPVKATTVNMVSTRYSRENPMKNFELASPTSSSPVLNEYHSNARSNIPRRPSMMPYTRILSKLDCGFVLNLKKC